MRRSAPTSPRTHPLAWRRWTEIDGFDALDGAVAGEVGTAHYGAPLREQRALAAGDAIVARDDRAVVTLTGADRLSWLDSITSQAVASLTPGTSTELLVLDPQGRIEHAAGLVDDGATTWLSVDADDASGLVRWLTMMRFRAQVEISLREDLSVLGWFGGGAAQEKLEQAGITLAVWQDPWYRIGDGGYQYALEPNHPAAEYRLQEAVVPTSAVAELAQALAPAQPAGLLAVDALRIAAWRPRWANERDDRTIPHELDWIRSAVHLNKGCYRGQETVAKVHNLGHPPRRLTMLHLDGSDDVLPRVGDAVRLGDESVGVVTSVANHYELGPVALAVLPRRVPADAVLTVVVDETLVAAAQQVIVPADAGATADVPRLTRLSRRPLKTD